MSVKTTQIPAKKRTVEFSDSSPYKKVYSSPRRKSPSPERPSKEQEQLTNKSPEPQNNNSESTDQLEPPTAQDVQSPPNPEVKRKRGRPPKNKTASNPTPTQKEGSTETPEKRKRGRPPKKPKPAEQPVERIVVERDSD